MAIVCYGVIDKNGSLWFDDFETAQEAQVSAEVMDNMWSGLAPFEVVPIDG